MEDEMSLDILWAEDGTVTPSVAHDESEDMMNFGSVTSAQQVVESDNLLASSELQDPSDNRTLESATPAEQSVLSGEVAAQNTNDADTHIPILVDDTVKHKDVLVHRATIRHDANVIPLKIQQNVTYPCNLVFFRENFRERLNFLLCNV
ncbi:uncharacterized protein LOC124451719 [Xenia sp. Carnegie-2017]|uniref:uncharacterized protein LOC124451719 n=1 Tax=Xenia sp. Carnegie-2017 TaxID=2897299 RepID=UPI001F04E8B9|nr:uncharacterized protein LOC124451719 [Xenia sp. Carnegie-2017]